MSSERYDVIIVGSGAGGAAAAYQLAKAGKRVLVLEKGDHLPRDGSTLDVKQVFKDGLFKNQDLWVDGQNKMFVPGEYYNVGGKTKWYGAALLRFARHEFEPDVTHQCLGWPFRYEQLAPYYDEAERLLKVTTFENEPELQALLDRICAGEGGWRPDARRGDDGGRRVPVAWATRLASPYRATPSPGRSRNSGATAGSRQCVP